MAMLREAWNLGVINPEDANVPDARVLANSWSGLSRWGGVHTEVRRVRTLRVSNPDASTRMTS